jgi:5-methyltetrahydropteroyltriglutamate--homocysteine methyltransferase
MQRTKAPFRADEVGSLLRPPRIKEARARLEKGEISADDLRKAEDMEIEKVVHRQASTGLKLATDGEFRRSWWHFDFLKNLVGCELFHPDEGIQFAGIQTRHDAIRVIGKLDFPADHPMLDHFRFLKKHADAAHVTAKMTIPSPAVLHFRGGRRAISKQVYPDLEEFYLDLGKTYRKAVKAFYDAGCRYLQFDDTVWAYLCSQDELQKARERGDNPDGLQEIYARVINYAIAERPADMTITTHVCRGNFRSTWISSGGCDTCRRATRSWWSASSPPRAVNSKRRTTSSVGWRKLPGSCRWTSSRYRRNAASPLQRRATCSPRKSSGPS